MRFRDIPQYTGWGNYAVDHSWSDLPRVMERYRLEYGFESCPDFQRGHIWTLEQQTKFVEYGLRGGRHSMNILTNCPGWMKTWVGPFQMVDGLQRVTAVIEFMDNRVPVFGEIYFHQFDDRMHPMDPHFRWHVNDLATRGEVLQWYIDLNTGGTVHSQEEIDRVRKLLEEEKRRTL